MPPLNAPNPTNPTPPPGAAAPNLFWHHGAPGVEERRQVSGGRPVTIWLTGLSGAGKSTLAYALEERLLAQRRPCYVLDGDNLRHGLNRDLGFSPDERHENIRRAAEVARMMNQAGLVVVTAFISPLRADRALARQIIGAERYIEVHVSAPLAVCEGRDPKGLYARARSGQLGQFTGVSAPYEAPLAAALTLDTAVLDPAQCGEALRRHIERLFSDERQ